LILAFCVSGSTAAIHSEDASSTQAKKFLFNNYFLAPVHYIVKVTNTELQDIN